MHKRTRLFIVFVVLILGSISCFAAVALWKVLTRPPVYEIPRSKIGRTFKMVAGYELPKRKENVRAIFWDSRDPSVFVTFKTDADGIAYIWRTFGGPDAKPYMYDAEALGRQKESGWEPLGELSHAEKKWGIPHLFDVGLLKSAWSLTAMVGIDRTSHAVFREYRILVDTENNIVYMWAMRAG